MNRKRLYFFYPTAAAAALLLELLPGGAVLLFAVSPEKLLRQTFSFFSLVPLGYGNFGPFAAALLTCALFLFSLYFLWHPSRFLLFLLKLVSCAAFICSVLPGVLSIHLFSFHSVLISSILLAEFLLLLKADLSGISSR